VRLLALSRWFQKGPRLFWLVFPALVTAAISIILNLQSSIRLDEAQQLWASTKTIPGILIYIAQDVHVPLYALLLHIWMQIFGQSIVVARLLSVLFFVLSLWPLYKMAQKTGGEKIARITVSLYCLSPFLTWYSTEARMYTLFTLATILSHLAFFTVLRSHAKKGKLFYLLVGILGVYSHYFFFIVLFLQALYYLLTVWLKETEDKTLTFGAKLRLHWPALWRYGSVLLLIFVSFLPWFLTMISAGAGSNTKPNLAPPTSYNLLQVFINFVTGFQSPSVESLLISVWPLLVVLLFFTFSRKKRIYPLYTDYFAVVTFIPVVLVFLASYIQPVLLSRYLIFLTPTLFYLLAVLLTHFNRFLFGAIVAIIFIGNIFFQYQQLFSPEIRERENFLGVAEYLSEKTSGSDVVAVSAPFTVYPIEYNYQGSARIDTIPNWNRYETGSIPPFSAEELDAQITQYGQQYDRVFVVLSYDQGYEQEIREYFANAYQLNSEEEFSPGLEVLEYQLRYD